MYPVFFEPAGLCMDLGACTIKSLATGTCEECTGGVMAIAEIVGSEETLVQVIDFLKVYLYSLLHRRVYHLLD